MKSRVRGARTPGVNLVPMIDVLMSVLTFFVILTMSLTGKVIADLEPPQGSGNPVEQEASSPPRFEVGLNRHGELLVEGKVVEQEAFLQAIAIFLETHPQSEVRLTADSQLNFRQVDDLLTQMAEVGGDRVLLVMGK
ncbi:biopolymer transporter ExbD [Synechocystis sp. PCC 7339]|uniref:ExbD/TolR family protein n=1 Tax=unclassified Synechocystis TaxID=2640012 RepID=UPI001BAE787E|nr:biopolymer transporter ExbD [Synechocystis sp. PCC 7339]QUS60918.1 biopolymer transporter ExbD [Synechocystis sp. PCC 7338]UAJ73101.1 biopolymer transporter ExbD [Synechocystis sp. PCC 7339]